MRVALPIALTLAALPLAAQSALPTWSLREDWRLRTDAVDLVQVQGLTVLSDGGFIVVAGQGRQIHRFDPGGRHRFTAGREGRGPGEFVAPGTARVSGDSVWVYDLLGRRLTVFGPAGRYVRSVETAGSWAFRGDDPSLAGRKGTGLMPEYLTRDGRIIGWVNVAANAAGETSRSLLVRLEPDSTLHVVAERLAPGHYSVSWQVERAGGSILVPFAPRNLTGASADGRRVVVAVSEARDRGLSGLLLRVDDASSGAVTELRSTHRAVPVTRARRDSAMEATRRVVGRGSSPPASTFTQLEARIPPTADLIAGGRGLLVAPDGTMYLPLQTADHSTPRYAVYTAAGVQTGWFSVPRGTLLRAASNTHLWATVTDDDGFPHIVRYAIVR